jgi:DoxX-like protein
MATIASSPGDPYAAFVERTRVKTPARSKSATWGGWLMMAIPVLFLLFDGVVKLIPIAPVTESFGQLGWAVSLARGIGILELACLVVFVIPRTSVLGAVLLTGYLGGAVATHVRIGNPLFSNVLFPVYIGILIWGSLCLRDERVRALIPVRR